MDKTKLVVGLFLAASLVTAGCATNTDSSDDCEDKNEQVCEQDSSSSGYVKPSSSSGHKSSISSGRSSSGAKGGVGRSSGGSSS